MRIVRWFFGLIILAALAAGVAYYYAGTLDGPAITINQPSVIGQGGTLDVSIDAPAAELTTLTIQLEQKGKVFPVLDMATAETGALATEGDRIRITRPIGKKTLPELEGGAATLTVSASRPVLRGLRQVSSQASRDIQVRLIPPRIAVLSTHHYVNQGGTEMIVYRVTPADVESGVRVGDMTYPGFAGTGAGLTDPEVRVAFFALLYNQAPDTAMEVVARDVAGNEARAQFEHRVFPKRFRNSTIPLDDKFLSRVVPAILQSSPELKVSADDLLPAFVKINNDLRRMNNETIAAVAKKTAPRILWQGAFQPLGNSQVESSFADFRTYLYGGKDVDRQVHLGFDLAKTANAPIAAANNGTVMLARELGIYGNTVILDHGMGVQSLYAHLSSFAVKEGDSVKTGQTLGASGQTGLAGGDHLHFSMMVNGQFVNATEWWDPHWIEDRIMRKFRP
ncbi:MAG TPA: M23 family metallopeptidase [Vicinamibacterales bacterium]|nr:M23 family metallopeptidase [Vicinamibacterales bacterium]